MRVFMALKRAKKWMTTTVVRNRTASFLLARIFLGAPCKMASVNMPWSRFVTSWWSDSLLVRVASPDSVMV